MFKSPRDSSQVNHLVRQMFPGYVKYMQEAFEDATKRAYGYSSCDAKPETPTDFQLHTNIFPGETLYAYVKKYKKCEPIQISSVKHGTATEEEPS